MKVQQFEETKVKYKGYFLLSLLITILAIGGFTCLILFCKDFMFKMQAKEGLDLPADASFGEYIWQNIMSTNQFVRNITISFVTLDCFSILMSIPLIWYGVRCILGYITFSKWINSYLKKHTQIVSCADLSNCQERVAMCVMTCNDLVPPTILQTMRQTYKNMDVWICDDSKKPDQVKMIDDFAKSNGIKVYRRPESHRQQFKSKVGNLFGFLEAHGSEYDYIFENDSSTLTTPNFVENALRYFHSSETRNEHIGAVVGFGAFFSTQNLLSYINAEYAQFNETHIIGSSFRTEGHPLFLHGWGCVYKTEVLMSMRPDLLKISCPTDDMARGCWLNKHGWKAYLNPFDFTGKIGVRTMSGYAAQRLKWNTGDVHMFRKHILTGKMNGAKNQMYGFFHSWPTISFGLLLPASIASAILKFSITFFYWNFSLLVLSIAGIVALIILIVLIFIIFQVDILPFIFFCLIGIPEGALTYKRWKTLVITGWIRHKWSTAAVTLKEVIPSTSQAKWKDCRNDLIFILIVTLVMLGLNFALPYMHIPRFNNFSYMIWWLSIYPLLVVPPVIYVICVWLGEAYINKGWDGKSDHFDFYKDDFRYKYVKETEVWKKQNPNKVE